MTSWTFFDGRWIEGNPPIMGPMDHGFWMASTVFDGARAFEGVTPDLDLHCARVVNSVRSFGMDPLHRPEEVLELCQDGLRHFAKDAALYIRPTYWAASGFVCPDRDSAQFCLTIHEAPMPEPKGLAITLSSYRRPTPEQAPTDAKASCLYPNSGRALQEAAAKGFDNAIVLDAHGDVAELATANIWLAKDGAAHTPVPNGAFLNGITKQRVARLLAERGIAVHERRLSYQDFLEADEIFSTGNYGKVMPVSRIDDRALQPGPIYTTAREAYWDWAHNG